MCKSLKSEMKEKGQYISSHAQNVKCIGQIVQEIYIEEKEIVK